jgi:probable HAF family extracellular repeat protein
MVGLGFLPNGIESEANRVSADGSVIVGQSGTLPPGSITVRQEAFRWTQSDGMVALRDLPGQRLFSQAFDVSADGSVIVGAADLFEGGTTVNRAFYWTPANGMLSLRDALISAGVANLDGWTLNVARGVSYDGLTIVGTGIHNGVSEAWVATIPEPSTLVLGALLLAGAVIVASVPRNVRRKAKNVPPRFPICVASAHKGRAANPKASGVCVSNQFVDPIIGAGI